MKIKGRVFKFGDNIDTDVIIPARYLTSQNPEELAFHCMEPLKKDLYKRVKKNDIFVAGKNFGCGSSREHAPLSIRGLGIGCVIAKSFSRIFFRSAINIGLVVIELPQVEQIYEADILEVDLSKGIIRNITRGKSYAFNKYPPFLQEIVRCRGLLRWLRKKGIK